MQAQEIITLDEPWQARTLHVLEMVLAERTRQMAKHGTAMSALPDGTGPDVEWLAPVVDVARSAYVGPLGGHQIEKLLRESYVQHRGAENPNGRFGQLTRLHLILEEVAESFELDGNDPQLIVELIQVAALCVQWVEIKLEEQT